MQTGPTDLPTKYEKMNNFANFEPIKLKFNMQVPFTRPRATVAFGIDAMIFSPTNLTYQKVAYSEFVTKLPSRTQYSSDFLS